MKWKRGRKHGQNGSNSNSSKNNQDMDSEEESDGYDEAVEFDNDLNDEKYSEQHNSSSSNSDNE